MNPKIKISQLPAKGANLAAADLLEVAEFTGTGYISKSITGQEIIDAAAGSGVTSVTGSAPIASSGGATPDISIAQATTFDDGYLTSSDWSTFNGKQDALVSATNIKTINGNSVLGSGDLVVSGGGGGGIHLQRNLPSGAFGHLFVTYSGFTTQNPTANRLILMPFIPNQSLTIQNLSVNCTTLAVGGLAKILIYSDVSGTPTTKLYESANLDTSTTGIKTATTTFNFVAGTTYWLSFICNNATNIFNYYGQTAILQFSGGSFGSATHCFLNTTFASIPNTLPSVNVASGNVPAIQIQRA